jgi:hypothetical protein
MKKPEEPNPSATIQLDLRDLKLEDPNAAEASSPRSRATPPPLPPSALSPTPPPASYGPAPAAYAPPPAPSAPRAASSSRTVVYGALFLVLLAGAIFGGVKVGSALRAAPAASRDVPPAPGPAPAASDTPVVNVVSIPTVEFTGPPADAQ